MPKRQKIVFKPFTGETGLQYQLNKAPEAVIGNHKFPVANGFYGAEVGLKSKKEDSCLKRRTESLDQTESQPKLGKGGAQDETSGEDGRPSSASSSTMAGVTGSSIGSSSEDGVDVVYAQNMTVALEPQEAAQNEDPSEDEISLLTGQVAAARVYDRTRDRASGSSCLPKRVTNWDTFKEPALLRARLAPEEEFQGPYSEGRRPTGVSSTSDRDRISTSSSQPQLHQHQHLILVNDQPVPEDTGQSQSSGTLVKSMSSPNLKSPGRPVTPRKDDKDETFWEKIGTLGRKKRIKEVQNFEAEGKNAIDSPGSPTQFDISPDEYDLAEGDERSLIERRSYADPKLQHLISLLIDWINDELADQRIIVKSIEDDLYDGQILQKLLEKLTGHKLEVPEVSQSEEGQRHKLSVVLNACTQVLGLARWSQQKWSVESIHSKNLVSILYLLVHLVRHFRAPLRLPENVNVETVVVKKRDGKLEYRRVTEEITSTYDEFGMRCERDAFDALLDHAPDKLQVVKKSLITFVNKHLNKINLEVTDIESQFHDGVYLILLMGLLEGYFVPLFEFHLTPKDFEQKVFNVAFSFELMQDAGISKPKARPEDIVNVDLKSTLRVLYNLFAKYKNVN